MKNIYLYTAFLMFILISCNDSKQTENQEESSYLTLTKQQFDSENMKLGVPLKTLFEEKVHFTGKIIPQMNGLASVFVPFEGVIKKINVSVGEYIKEGQAIMEIGGNSFIDLQQQFMSTAAHFKQCKADYERGKKLYDENIKTESEFLILESNYKTAYANYNALKMKLQAVGIDVTKTELGIFKEVYQLKASIAGQLVNANFSLGQYVNKEQDIADIIDGTKLHLQLNLFEKDIAEIKIGQKVLFSAGSFQGRLYEAIVKQVTKMQNNLTKSFECYAQIKNIENSMLVVNQVVNGSVVVESDSVYALPEVAIHKSGAERYVFAIVKEEDIEYQLNKIEIKTGRVDGDYIEVINPPENQQILIEGGYFLE